MILKFNEKKLKNKDILMFFRQYQRFIKAGISPSESLTHIYNQCENKLLKNTISQMIADIDNGYTISDAFEKAKIFPEYCSKNLKSGEKSGTVEETLNNIVEDLEQNDEINRQIKVSLLPVKIFLILSLFAMFIGIFLVIPKFAEILKSLKTTLPFLTQLVLNISQGLVNYWYIELMVLILSFFGIRYYKQKNPEFFDRMVFKIPFYKELYWNKLQYQFSRVLSLTSKSVPSTEALYLTANSIDNIVVKKNLLKALKHLQNGIPLAEAIIKENKEEYISKNTLIMINAGTLSGDIAETLEEVSKDYKKDLIALTKTIGEKMSTAIVIPTLTILLIACGSVYMPVMKIMFASTHR